MRESYLAPRAAQRQDGFGCSTAPLCSDVCWVRDARSPTETDSQGRKRLAPLAEVSGLQEAAVTVGYVAAAWLLGSPPRPEDSVDGRTLRYLLIVNLALMMKEEKEAEAGGGGVRGAHAATRPCSKLRSSPWPNLAHGVLGLATSPARRSTGRGRKGC